VCGIPLRRLENEITNKIRQMGGRESPTALLRELECAAFLPTWATVLHHAAPCSLQGVR